MRSLAWFVLFGVAALQAEDRRVPVIVELFTSEGCSSCPSADGLLARMERTQPVAGARVIALEEHVDYWNQLGWTDPFSGPQYRIRQNDYAVAFRTESVFTPQMIVNGQSSFVGDDAKTAFEVIEKAAQSQFAVVDLKAAANPKDSKLVDLTIRVTHPEHTKMREAGVYLAVTENDLSSNVMRGENAGRMLRHAAVVRSFGLIGRFDAKGSNSGTVLSTLKLPPEWKRENLQAVVFVQERESLRITGAGAIDLR